jgi:hypothetical protein
MLPEPRRDRGIKVPCDRDDTLVPPPWKARVSVYLAERVPFSRAESSGLELGEMFIGYLTTNEKSRKADPASTSVLEGTRFPQERTPSVTTRYGNIREGGDPTNWGWSEPMTRR